MSEHKTKKRMKVEPLLGVLALFFLFLGCFSVLKPFLSALLWATILAYALYPLQHWFTQLFRGSRTLAACFVTLTLTIVLAVPIVLVGVSVAEDGKAFAVTARKWFFSVPQEAPAWIVNLPVVGNDAKQYWADFSQDRNRWMAQLDQEVKQPVPRPKIVIEDEGGMILKDAPPVEAVEMPVVPEPEPKPPASPPTVVLLGQVLVTARAALLSIGLAVTNGVTQVLMSAFLAFFILRDAPTLAERLVNTVDRLGGERGIRLIKVAGDTVRGVITGILGTAIAQAIVAAIGFWISGVPGCVLLSVLTFFFAVIPFGPPMIWVPATLWLFSENQTGHAIFLGLWGLLAISGVDNFLRPFLISQGNKMPFVLIFCGVIGGAIGFGLVGIFLGPTLLAVGFRLIEEWSSRGQSRPLEEGAASLADELAEER